MPSESSQTDGREATPPSGSANATPGRSANGHALPVVEIRFSDLNHTVGVSIADQTPTNIFLQVGRGISRVAGAIVCQDNSERRRLGVLRVSRRIDTGKGIFSAPYASSNTCLQGLSGVLRAGSSTLVLAAPGSGTSTLLRLLSGRERPQAAESITYNGVTQVRQGLTCSFCCSLVKYPRRPAQGAIAAAGINLRRLAAYAPENDDHEPLLTVTETFQFAYDMSVPPPIWKQVRRRDDPPLVAGAWARAFQDP